jgi:hypothetical protein
METEEQLNEQICMDVNEQILADVAFSLDVSDDIYQKALKEFHSQRLRYKMGGNEGIHSIVKDTEEDGN